MSNVNVLKALVALPALIVAVPGLASEVKSLQADQALVSALKTAPLLSARIATLSAEWRQVEQDEQAVAKSNFFSFFTSVPRLLKDAGILEADVTNAQANAALVAEVKGNPILQAHLQTIATEWQMVEAAIKAFQ